MSVTGFKEQERRPLKQRQNGSWHGVRTFEFTASDDTATTDQLLAYAGAPTRGDAHPDKASCLLRTFEPAYLAEGFQNVHVLKCRYDSETQFDPDDSTVNALVKAGFRSQDRQVPAVFDAFGMPNVNTAGDLIPGLVRLANEFVIPVTASLAAIPTYLLTLNNTLNDAAFTIRGIDFQPGTLMLKDVDISDTPDIDTETGTGFWTVTFNIVHNPDGFYELHPNRGKHELVYSVRDDADSAWEVTTPADYDAAPDDANRKIEKHRIRTSDDQAAGQDMWLDSRGQAMHNPSFVSTSIGNGSMLLRDFTLTLTSGTFPIDGSINGATVTIAGAGSHGRSLQTVIESVTDSTHAELADLCAQAVTSVAVYLPGVIAIRVINQPLADWASVPVPNNDP